MTKEEYRGLFASALEQAAKNADSKLGYSIPREIQIELFDKIHSGDIVDFEVALDSLYLGSDDSYYVIDIGVKEVHRTFTKVFVRGSGHKPVKYEAAWSSPEGDRLFKQVFPEIKISTES